MCFEVVWNVALRLFVLRLFEGCFEVVLRLVSELVLRLFEGF